MPNIRKKRVRSHILILSFGNTLEAQKHNLCIFLFSLSFRVQGYLARRMFGFPLALATITIWSLGFVVRVELGYILNVALQCSRQPSH